MYRLAFASLVLAASPAAVAQDAMTQLGAHVHGASTLAIAADPNTGVLTIEMQGPAYNVYGFERAPQNAEEAQMVERIHAGLLGGDQFALSDRAGCTWQDGDIIGGAAHTDHEDDHDGHDHGQDHSHDHGDEDGHSDMLVRWSFQCEAPGALDRVDAAGLFEILPTLESLDAQFFDGVRAAAGDLTRQRPTLVIE